jgi:hypothetical protein
MFYVYEHVRPDTKEVFYVGKGQKKRAYSLKRNNDWKKIVAENNGEFEVRIINWFNNEDHALNAERYIIKQRKKDLELANKTSGGQGISGCIRHDMIGVKNIMHTPEHKARMLGDANPMKNPETVKKAADSNRGQKRSPDILYKWAGENNPMFGKPSSEKQKQAVSATHTGVPKSYTQRSKTSTKVRGKNNGMYGKSGSLNPMYGKESAMKGRKNPIAAFANYIRHIPYWGA